MNDAELDARLPGLSYEHRDSESRYWIHLERRGSLLAIVLSGSLLTPAPESFVERVADSLAAQRERPVLVDMSGCEYLSSSAISHIIRYVDAAEKGACKVVICNPQPKVKVVLDLLGLSSVCPIMADEQEAARWFSEQGMAS